MCDCRWILIGLHSCASLVLPIRIYCWQNRYYLLPRLFLSRGRHCAKVFSIKLDQLRLPPLLQLSPCLFSSNLSIFSLAFLTFFYQVLPSLSLFSQRNLLSSSRVHTNITLCPKVCLSALQILLSLSHTPLPFLVTLNANLTIFNSTASIFSTCFLVIPIVSIP